MKATLKLPVLKAFHLNDKFMLRLFYLLSSKFAFFFLFSVFKEYITNVSYRHITSQILLFVLQCCSVTVF